MLVVLVPIVAVALFVVFVRWRAKHDWVPKSMVTAGSRERRAIPISAYVGANGSGKSLAMVHDTLPTLDGVEWECDNPAHEHMKEGKTKGLRRVLSTVQLLEVVNGDGGTEVVVAGEGHDGEEARAHPLCDLLTTWRQVVKAEHCDVLLDEVTGAAGSRSHASLPPQMIQLFVQLRRRDVILRYTTPNWARSEVVLREVTQAVTVCRGFFWERTPGLLWPSKRLFRWATYDAIDWEELSMEKVRMTKPLKVGWYWRPGQRAMFAYSTRDAVTTLDHISEAGMCLECGGTRMKPKCVCGVKEREALVARPAAGGRPASAGRLPAPSGLELLATGAVVSAVEGGPSVDVGPPAELAVAPVPSDHPRIWNGHAAE